MLIKFSKLWFVLILDLMSHTPYKMFTELKQNYHNNIRNEGRAFLICFDLQTYLHYSRGPRPTRLSKPLLLIDLNNSFFKSSISLSKATNTTLLLLIIDQHFYYTNYNVFEKILIRFEINFHRGRIHSITRHMITSLAIKTYDDMRLYWRNVHGYEILEQVFTF